MLGTWEKESNAKIWTRVGPTMHYIRMLFEAIPLFIVSKFDVKCLLLPPQIKINIERYLVRKHSNVTMVGFIEI
jgi:hypothetical protein